MTQTAYRTTRPGWRIARSGRVLSSAVSVFLLTAVIAPAPGPAQADARLQHTAMGGKEASGNNAGVREARLDSLFAELGKARSQAEARAVEAQIWALWHESGHERTDSLLRDALEAMQRRYFEGALMFLDELVEKSPEFAEGWNKRATVYYLMGRYEDSVADIERTLELEPRHFGAISGLALIRLAQGDNAAALDAIKRALEIHPMLPGAKRMLEQASGGRASDPI